MTVSSTYSFMDVAATIDGPGGKFALGYGSCNAEEGVSIAMVENKNLMTIGADGCVMHSLHAGNGGTVTVRFLKTSPTNKMLSMMYELQKISSATWGNNNIVISDIARGDQITCSNCAFQRQPNVNYAKDGGTQEWIFDAGYIGVILGDGGASTEGQIFGTGTGKLDDGFAFVVPPGQTQQTSPGGF
jgi:hypothetical protein